MHLSDSGDRRLERIVTSGRYGRRDCRPFRADFEINTVSPPMGYDTLRRRPNHALSAQGTIPPVYSSSARWARRSHTSAPRDPGKRLLTHVWASSMRGIPGSSIRPHVSTCETEDFSELALQMSKLRYHERATVNSKHFEDICNACLIRRN